MKQFCTPFRFYGKRNYVVFNLFGISLRDGVIQDGLSLAYRPVGFFTADFINIKETLLVFLSFVKSMKKVKKFL